MSSRAHWSSACSSAATMRWASSGSRRTYSARRNYLSVSQVQERFHNGGHPRGDDPDPYNPVSGSLLPAHPKNRPSPLGGLHAHVGARRRERGGGGPTDRPAAL